MTETKFELRTIAQPPPPPPPKKKKKKIIMIHPLCALDWPRLKEISKWLIWLARFEFPLLKSNQSNDVSPEPLVLRAPGSAPEQAPQGTGIGDEVILKEMEHVQSITIVVSFFIIIQFLHVAVLYRNSYNLWKHLYLIRHLRRKPDHI